MKFIKKKIRNEDYYEFFLINDFIFFDQNTHDIDLQLELYY